MNRQLDNKAASYTNTLSLLKANADKMEDVPDLVVDTAVLEVICGELKEAMKSYDKLMDGKSSDKIKAETALLDAIQPVKSKLKSYASKQDGQTLKELAALSLTAMKAMRDAEFLRYAEKFLDAVTSQPDKLKRSGLKQDGIDRLATAIKAFDTSMTDRDESRSGKTGVGATMYALEAKIDALLNNSIDPLVESIYEEQPEFYTAYFATRTVSDHGIRHRKPVEPPKPEPPVA